MALSKYLQLELATWTGNWEQTCDSNHGISTKRTLTHHGQVRLLASLDRASVWLSIGCTCHDHL